MKNNKKLNIDDRFLNACRYQTLDEVRKFLKKGANINTHQNAAVTICANSNNIPLLQFLLENGAIIPTLSEKHSIIYSCIYNGYLEMVQFLVTQGQDLKPHLTTNNVKHCAYNNHDDLFKYLVEQGADLHGKDEEVLTIFICNGKIDMFHYCVEKGCDIEKSLNGVIWNDKNIHIKKWYDAYLLQTKLEDTLSTNHTQHLLKMKL